MTLLAFFEDGDNKTIVPYESTGGFYRFRDSTGRARLVKQNQSIKAVPVTDASGLIDAYAAEDTGNLGLTFTLIAAIGATIMAWIFNLEGNYFGAFISLVVSGLAAFGGVNLYVKQRGRRRVMQQLEQGPAVFRYFRHSGTGTIELPLGDAMGMVSQFVHHMERNTVQFDPEKGGYRSINVKETSTALVGTGFIAPDAAVRFVLSWANVFQGGETEGALREGILDRLASLSENVAPYVIGAVVGNYMGLPLYSQPAISAAIHDPNSKIMLYAPVVAIVIIGGLLLWMKNRR